MSNKKTYMTDEELNAAGFGFLTKNPRIKVMPVVGERFSISWTTSEYSGTERLYTQSDFGGSRMNAGEVVHYENVKHSIDGKILFAGNEIAVVLCEKTGKEISVSISKSIFQKK